MEFARSQNQPEGDFIAMEEKKAGMVEMSKVCDETGREFYMRADDREHG